MAARQQVLEAFRYYIDHGGYYEKASAKNLSRDVSDFAKNKGSGNYTYMGRLCGCNPGAWCAMMVSTAVYEACGSDRSRAREAMWGRWPHYNCGTLADDAMARGLFHWSWYGRNKKGKSGAAYTPKAGDVIIFTDAWRTRDHTGMVYAVDAARVYTYEGNSGQMARKRSYDLTSAYIYGYASLALEEAADAQTEGPVAQFQRWLGVAADGVYGPQTQKAAIAAHQRALNEAGTSIAVDGVWGPESYYATGTLRSGDSGDDVTVWQGLLYAKGFDPVGLDGDYGPNTTKATEAFQTASGLNATGQADAYTWARMFGAGRPAHSALRAGSRGAEVLYLQKLLWARGYVLARDGSYGSGTADDVADFQKSKGLEADGVCGPATWAALE